MEFTREQIAYLTREKAVSATPTYTYGHGSGGLFAYPGLERRVTNAMPMPRYGLLNMLPSRTANTDNPLYAIMTGVTDSSGSERATACADPPVSGLMKLCTHAFQWGRFARQTRVIDIRRLGRFRDRSDFDDLELLGGPEMDNAKNAAVPTLPGMADASKALQSDINKALFELAVTWGRDFARLVWTGNPTANIGDGYWEPYGLDLLINDGYRDAVSGVACPAADSIVKDMSNAEVNTSGTTYVTWITSIYNRLKTNAQMFGLDPATWAITMRSSLFYELTRVWACAYYTDRCGTAGTFSTSQVQVIDSNDTIRLRDDMRSGKYLLIDGDKVPVAIDDTIVETALVGSSYRSKIYFVPLRVQGNTPVTFLEYFNYDAPGAARDASKLFAPNQYYTTNGGRYLWTPKTSTNGCVQLMGEADWRIILETPQIAAVMENVKWTPIAHERDWDPDGSFYVDGGGTSRTDNSYYTPTA